MYDLFKQITEESPAAVVKTLPTASSYALFLSAMSALAVREHELRNAKDHFFTSPETKEHAENIERTIVAFSVVIGTLTGAAYLSDMAAPTFAAAAAAVAVFSEQVVKQVTADIEYEAEQRKRGRSLFPDDSRVEPQPKDTSTCFGM